MHSNKSEKTQSIDERLMASLDKLSQPQSPQLFPVVKKGIWRRKPKQPTKRPVTGSAKSTSLVDTAPTIVSQDPAQIAKKKHRTFVMLLIIPTLGVLLLAVVSIASRSSAVQLMSDSFEGMLFTLFSILEIPCIIALALLYAGVTRQRYVFASSNELPSKKKDYFIPLLLTLFPVGIIVLTSLLLILFPTTNVTINTLMGFSYLLIITGPLCLVAGFICLGILLLYKKGREVRYPGLIYIAIDYIERTFK